MDHWEPEFDPETGRARFDVARLEALLDPARGGARARLVVVNFPHNPTGAHLAAGEQARVVAACRAAGAHLFSDEMY